MRSKMLLVLLVTALAACGGGEPAGPRAVIATSGADVTVEVEVADSSSERERGLMGRESLDEGTGMIFLYPGETHGAFWMKDTLIPLSIAFYDRGGRILAILDMEPCRRDPCRLYEPGVAYRGALEVNRGAFARWGVRVGDRLRLER